MKKIFVIMTVLSICSIFLVSSGWAFWPFSSGESKEQIKIIELEKQLQFAQQKAAQAESSYNLMIGLCIATGLMGLVVGSALMLRTKRDKKAQDNAVRRDNNERE